MAKSSAFSLAGYTLLPLSTFIFNPLDSKKSIRSELKNRAKPFRKKSPFLYLGKNSSRVLKFVILPRLFPVKRSFLQISLFFSRRSILLPFSLACIAAIQPAGPAPTIMTSKYSFLSSIKLYFLLLNTELSAFYTFPTLSSTLGGEQWGLSAIANLR